VLPNLLLLLTSLWYCIYAIMGCIVNGPGEMADADFGYVGGAPGKIDLYVGKVQYSSFPLYSCTLPLYFFCGLLHMKGRHSGASHVVCGYSCVLSPCNVSTFPIFF